MVTTAMQIPDELNKITLDTPTQRTAVECPVEDWLKFLGHRWNALLLWHLFDSPKCHSELLKLLSGISSKVLTERLKSLALRGLLIKTPLATFPRTVRYELSQQGVAITKILNQIELWTKSSNS